MDQNLIRFYSRSWLLTSDEDKKDERTNEQEAHEKQKFMYFDVVKLYHSDLV